MTNNLTFSILALVLGIGGWYFVFSDLSLDESLTMRIVTATIFFFLSGFAIGYFNPKAWMLSGLTAWSGVIMGGIITLGAIGKYGGNAFGAQEPPYISAGLTMLFIPLGLALTGGYAGKIFGKKDLSK